MIPLTFEIQDEAEMLAFGAGLARQFQAGDIVLLFGDLGAGKTTLVRGIVRGLGFEGGVRSPTFNLLQSFPTDPPILHADLYRLGSAAGVGLEDYLDTHVSFIEWPDRLGDLADPATCTQIRIDFVDAGRRVTITPPQTPSSE